MADRAFAFGRYDGGCRRYNAPIGQLRRLLLYQHKKRKRNKGFGTGEHGCRWLILDVHEGGSSYRRSWPEALERVVHFAKGDKTRYYFHFVEAYLTNGRDSLSLDEEQQLSGEGDVTCAIRWLERLFQCCPRVFDGVCGNNAYIDPKREKLVCRHPKHRIAVLKKGKRELPVDA